MPTVKTPEERGTLGAWAYESRLALDLSPEQVVLILPLKDGKPYNPATLRKAEADSGDMSRPLWRHLVKLYSRLAREKAVILAPIPMGSEPPTPAGDMGALIATMQRLIEELQLARGERDTAQQVLMQALAAALGQSGKKPGAGRGTRGRTARSGPRRELNADPQVTQ